VQNEAHSIDFGGGFDGQYLEAELSADLAACAYRKSNPGILVVQSAKDRTADNACNCFGGAPTRRILVQ
jgi:hypothetical protein